MTFSIDNLEGGCNNPPYENMFGKNPQDNKGYRIPKYILVGYFEKGINPACMLLFETI